VPKPGGARGRFAGLIGPNGEVILANSQVPTLSFNNKSMFIPGGPDNS